jgi:hypothetical protein
MMCWVCWSHCVKVSYHLLFQGSSSPRKILLLVLFDPEDADIKILQKNGNCSTKDIVSQCFERTRIHNRATMRNQNLAMKWNSMVYITFLKSASHTRVHSFQFKNMNATPSGSYNLNKWTRQQCPIKYMSYSSQRENTSTQEAFKLTVLQPWHKCDI